MMDFFGEKDDTKRKSRNLSEKKRRDQFNVLINELGTMVSPASHRKMDKTSLLRCTIAFLRDQKDAAVQSRANEIHEDWKPAFLTNEEFTHLMLEALDGFLLAIDTEGLIHYVSESVSSLLGHVPNDLNKKFIYDITMEDDQKLVHSLLQSYNGNNDQPKELVLHLKRFAIISQDEIYELVKLKGHFCQLNCEPSRPASVTDDDNVSVKTTRADASPSVSPSTFFVATARLQTAQLIRELPIVSSSKHEFTSRYSLEWKFLYLDHRAPPIIGFLPFELLGTSGYDYYHPDDLDRVTRCHEALLQTGEGTSCCHRFFTKGQNWIWLQTRYYITYHQWNSKPEFVVANHRVLNITEVIKLLKKEREAEDEKNEEPKSRPHGSNSCSSISSFCCSTSTRVSQGQSSCKLSACSDTGRSDSTVEVPQPPGSSSSIVTSTHNHEQSQHISAQDRIDQIRAAFMTQAQAQNQPLPTPTTTGHVPQQMTRREVETDRNSNKRVSGLQDCAMNVDLNSMPPPVQPGSSTNSQSQALKPRVYLTPAQLMLQQQLREKHANLTKRIAQQQEELKRIGDLLILSQFGDLVQSTTDPGVLHVINPGGGFTSHPSPINHSPASQFPQQLQQHQPMLQQQSMIQPSFPNMCFMQMADPKHM